MLRLSVAFTLQFPICEISEWASRYAYRDESGAMAAGHAIASGEYTRANLMTIHRWKTKGRGAARLDRNTDAEVADALGLAVAAKTDRAAASVLCGLAGVRLPVASAILTAIDPARFTIIDFRALESLDAADRYVDLALYLEYLGHCRGLAANARVSLRTLDKALWQWSATNGTRLQPDEQA